MIAEFHNNSHHAEYESKILVLMSHVARQDETLKAQAIQVHHLTEQLSTQIQHTDNAQHTLELQPQSSENASVHPRVTFTELTAETDKPIHANKHSSDGVDSTQSSLKAQTKFLPPCTTPVSMRNIPSHRDSGGGSHSPKQSIIVKNITSESKYFSEGPQEESSSDSSHQTLITKTGTTSMYGHIDQELNTADKARSPQGSKDSGLDSPKRFSMTPVRKINAFEGLSSIETTPVTSASKDMVDNVDEATQSEDGEEEEEEKETVSDETTADDTETDTDTEPAIRSVHR
jgi:hypothetical protein